LRRNHRSAYSTKDYILPSGKVIKIQGYEYLYLDYIFKTMGILEEDVICSLDSDKSCPIIRYIFDGKSHVYFPDIYIISPNLVVEIKSTWTYNENGKNTKKEDQVHKKLNATYDSGYNTLLLVYNGKKSLVYKEFKSHELPNSADISDLYTMQLNNEIITNDNKSKLDDIDPNNNYYFDQPDSDDINWNNKNDFIEIELKYINSNITNDLSEIELDGINIESNNRY